MADRLGNKLKVGDQVMFEGRVTEVADDKVLVQPIFGHTNENDKSFCPSTVERTHTVEEISGEADSQADGVKIGAVTGEAAES